MKNFKLKLAGGAAVLVGVAGGGAAIAADRLSPTEESDAIVADVAKQLGVDTAKVDAALEQALENRIDAAVTAGRLTEAQGAELKQRLESGDMPLLGFGGLRMHQGPMHHLADLGAAAKYLGVTETALKTNLQDGSTLAEIAAEKGKSVDGLKNALVAAAKADLAEAVADGKLTQAQKAELEADLPDRIDDLVNGELGFRRHGGPPGFGGQHGFGGPNGFGGSPQAEDDA